MSATASVERRAPAAAARRLASAFHDAWRGVSARELAWTLSIALTFVIAHAYSLNLAPGRNWPIPIRVYEWFYVPASLIFLVAFRFAEHPLNLRWPRWQRYGLVLPPAIFLYWYALHFVTAASQEHHNIAGLPARLWGAVQAVLVGIVVAIVYSSVMRSRRAQAAFDAAALARAASRRRVTTALLTTQQARLDPAFLFSSLELIDSLYEREPDAAEATLASLIDFLRTALPKLGEEGSTLGREAQLARAYLSIAGARMGSRLAVAIDVPPALESAAFPPMLLVPLVEDAVRALETLPHGGRVVVGAALKGDRLEAFVRHRGAPTRPDGEWLLSLHERVDGMYGASGHLGMAADGDEAVATLDIPYEGGVANVASVLPTPA